MGRLGYVSTIFNKSLYCFVLVILNSLSQPNCHSFHPPYLCTCKIKWFMAICLHFIQVAWTTILVPFFVGLDFFYTTDFFAGWLVLRSCLARKGWWQGEDTRFIHWGFFSYFFMICLSGWKSNFSVYYFVRDLMRHSQGFESLSTYFLFRSD